MLIPLKNPLSLEREFFIEKTPENFAPGFDMRDDFEARTFVVTAGFADNFDRREDLSMRFGQDDLS